MLLDNTIVTLTHPLSMSMRHIKPVPFVPGRTVGELAARNGPLNDVVVIHNRGPADLDAAVMPGDVVHVFPMVHGDDGLRSIAQIALIVVATYYIGPAAGKLAGGGAAGAFWGAVASTATITAGGMLINSLLPGPAPAVYGGGRGGGAGSPTYGWSAGRNTAAEGIAIPVIYGNVATWPQVINQWIEIDGDDQWSHTLMCVAEGLTNNVPTAESDIYIDDQPITTLDAESYVVNTTDGRQNPTAALTNFEKLHQMRPINKELITASLSNILHHFDGTQDATDFEDEGVGVANSPHRVPDSALVNTWTANGGAKLDTAHPFVGTACLDLETAGANISLDNWFAMDLWLVENWSFECRFRQDALTNAGIIGQSYVPATGDQYFWGVFYYSGNLVFQQYKSDGASTYTVHYNVSAAASISIDTWHHLGVNRSGDDIYLFLDGTLLTSAAYTNAPEYAAGAEITTGTLTAGSHYVIENLSDDDYEGSYFFGGCAEGDSFVANGATALTATNSVREITTTACSQAIGNAQYYTGSSDTALYGNCELDELRLTVNNHNYDLTGYTPPTVAIDDDAQQTFTTRGEVDSFSITTQCPYGLYHQDSAGGMNYMEVGLLVSYRKVGSTVWTRTNVYMWDKSRDPVTNQWEYTPAAGRGRYEIRLPRLISTNETELGNPAIEYQTTCHFLRIDEMLNESLIYPHLQLVAVSIKAQDKLHGTIPQYKIISNRTSITVPTYDDTGTRVVNPTNNAHAAFDALTNRVYGVGQDPVRIIEADWTAWAGNSSGTVDGESRCQINMAFDQSYDLDEALQHIEVCGRARVIRRGTQLTAVLEKPTSATALFAPPNITPGTNQTAYVRQSERSDAVELIYYDKDAEFAQRTVLAKGDGFDSLTRNARVVRIEARGINNYHQAMREAILRQQISESIRRQVSLQTGIEGIPVAVGDVFNHANGANTMAFSGRLTRGVARVEQWTGTTVYIDQEITLDTSTYSGNCILLVRNPDDSVDQYTVTGPFDSATRSITVSSSGTFDFLSPFMICRTTGEIYQFRANSIRRSGKMDVRIEGSQYVSSAYYHSNYGSGGTPI